ncbi:MAG: glycolate oxidase subunit GlcF, partial [Methylococcaceae bacterium]|nr:glycolate oxidase subunit GlcF [Methylococcaceae bacterium]
MQTELSPEISALPEGAQADQILRACVHCGFCAAACPTYRLLGDERDSPRGRIYLIKNLLEGHEAGGKTRLHLDRCLTCRSCETACPSGVQYSRLLEIGRQIVEQRSRRPFFERLQRWLLLQLLPYPERGGPLLRGAQRLSPYLPARLRRVIPPKQPIGPAPPARHRRRVLLLDGCIQSVAAPNINAAAARVLDRLGITAVPIKGCCGALAHHLPAVENGLATMRSNIDAWLPLLDQNCEAIVSTASGCGLMVKEYRQALQHDREYAERAARLSDATLDLVEIVAREDLTKLKAVPRQKPTCHTPCTLQHGQGLKGTVEKIMLELGFDLVDTLDADGCCGSAGSYSLFQAELSNRLLRQKIGALQTASPDCIVTANIGCLLHLQRGTETPVRHWIEAVSEALPPAQ